MTKLLVNEDNRTTYRAVNALGAYVDATNRGKIAMKQHNRFFNSNNHLDRIEAVTSIIKKFFNRYPDYTTPRGINGRPFEAIKISDVGRVLSRTPISVKNNELYAPLLALGNIDVKSKNGHLIVRIY